jgi:hypothetical protein
MESKFLALTSLLFLLTSCGQQKLSLPVTHAAVSLSAQESPSPAVEVTPPAEAQPAIDIFDDPAPTQTCYSYMRQRPKDQRDFAVQARLRKTDQMTAAFGSRIVTVDLLGDHANILSLQFPVIWPGNPAYFSRVSSVIESYLTTPEIQDYLCDAGFAEVQLSARGLNDGRLHALWTARITTEGLVKARP